MRETFELPKLGRTILNCPPENVARGVRTPVR